MSVKIDLHTHSTLSHDGGLTMNDYERLLNAHSLHTIAITDHNDIAFAQKAQKMFGEAIIVGEEIMTSEGEIIGLFLREKIDAGCSAAQTIAEIKKQGGLVYVPHPLETRRSGILPDTLASIVKHIDIVEVFNGRGIFTNKNREVGDFLRRSAGDHSFAEAASSDAHCLAGIGMSYSIVTDAVTRENLVAQLQKGELLTKYAPMYSLLCPKVNVLKKLFVSPSR